MMSDLDGRLKSSEREIGAVESNAEKKEQKKEAKQKKILLTMSEKEYAILELMTPLIYELGYINKNAMTYAVRWCIMTVAKTLKRRLENE